MKWVFIFVIYEGNIESDSQKSKQGHNWKKCFIGLFHVSGHVDHFKSIKYFHEKKRETVLVGGTPPPPPVC